MTGRYELAPLIRYAGLGLYTLKRTCQQNKEKDCERVPSPFDVSQNIFFYNV